MRSWANAISVVCSLQFRLGGFVTEEYLLEYDVSVLVFVGVVKVVVRRFGYGLRCSTGSLRNGR